MFKMSQKYGILSEKIPKARISSSISNFREKILNRFNFPEYNFPKDIFQKTIFFGLYGIHDYWRFIFHRGKRVVVWCGGDILNLKNGIGKHLIKYFNAVHFCENSVEQLFLAEYGIKAKVQPFCFDPDFSTLTISYKHSKNPQVFVCCHPGYEEEYGVNLLEGIAYTVPEVTFHVYGIDGTSHDNIKYHGYIVNTVFNQEIKNYQAGLRLNDFDGFGEVIAKSVLLGQYPISRIYYPFIDYAKDITSLINLLKDLKNKKKPNVNGRAYWFKELNRNPFL